MLRQIARIGRGTVLRLHLASHSKATLNALSTLSGSSAVRCLWTPTCLWSSWSKARGSLSSPYSSVRRPAYRRDEMYHPFSCDVTGINLCPNRVVSAQALGCRHHQRFPAMDVVATIDLPTSLHASRTRAVHRARRLATSANTLCPEIASGAP